MRTSSSRFRESKCKSRHRAVNRKLTGIALHAPCTFTYGGHGSFFKNQIKPAIPINKNGINIEYEGKRNVTQTELKFVYSVSRIKMSRSRQKGIPGSLFLLTKLDKAKQDICELFRIAFSLKDGIVLS